MSRKLPLVALGAMLVVGLRSAISPTYATSPPPPENIRLPAYFYHSVYDLFKWIWMSGARSAAGEDPTLVGATARHDPWKQTINGSESRVSGSRTSAVSVLVWGGFDLSDPIGLPANQRLAIGAFYRHDRAWTEFEGTGELSSRNNALGLLLAYTYDAWHLSGAAAFDWGEGKSTSLPSGAAGTFDISARSVAVQFGRTFTLSGDPHPADRATLASWPFGPQRMSVYLDPVFRVGYARGRADSFTNSAGTIFGKEIERAWTVGGSVTLSAVIPQGGGVLWRPYIEFSLDRQLGYRHTLDLPTTSQVAHLDHDKTYWGVSGGLGAWINRNISMGVSGFYRGSGSQDAGGGLFWIRVNLLGPGGYLRGGVRGR